jgi:hypothetical protein
MARSQPVEILAEVDGEKAALDPRLYFAVTLMSGIPKFWVEEIAQEENGTPFGECLA